MSFRRALLVLILPLIASALTACPPPPDPDSGTDPSGQTQSPDAGNPAGQQSTHTNSGTAGGGNADTRSNSGNNDPTIVVDPAANEAPAPRGAAGKDTPRRIAYVQVQGGVWSPRCPECGETQPEASTSCAGCNQALVAWERRTTCPACVGSGADARSGDDRPCSACDGGGSCPFCEGDGNLGDEPCPDCGANGRCEACQGDGVRERFGSDFRPLETTLPGACPTCIDGSGLCPECGSTTVDATGATCLSCAGTGVCNDCGGHGASPHDRGDGACIVCEGHGVEVRNGSPPLPSERVWNVRMTTGSLVTGIVAARPTTNLHIKTRGKDGKEERLGFMRNQVDPLSLYRVLHHWTTTSKEFIDLSQFAQNNGFWPLVLSSLRRAQQLDPTARDTVKAMLHDAQTRRSSNWLERAERAARAGDRERALVLLQMVKFEDVGGGRAQQAKVLFLKIRGQAESEQEKLDEATRQKVAQEAQQRVARILQRAELRLSLARRLLEEATRSKATDAAIETLFRRADRAVWSAERLLHAEAAREPLSKGAWKRPPHALLKSARALRASIVATHASRAVAAGRFAQGAHLARRALNLNAAEALATSALLEAERGLQRLGVQQGSPPPRK